jgi:uncharacterized secreted protein with C-terminal beta-propeller domain
MDNADRLMTRMLGALIVLAVATLVLLDGQSPTPAGAEPVGRTPGLHSMRSCPHLRSFLRRHGSTQPPIAVGVGAGIEGDTATPSEGGAAASPSPDSPTNLQEAGVDEPDIVKTAGDTILTVEGTTLRAVHAGIGDPRLRDSLELVDGPDSSPVSSYQLLVAGDRLLAIGAAYGYVVADGNATDSVAPPDVGYPGQPQTVLTEVDISDPSKLRILRTMTIDGSYVSARLTGSTVRLASSSYPAVPPAARGGHGRAFLPRFTLTDRRTGAERSRKLVSCREVDRPSRFAGSGMLSVLTIDLQRGLPAIDADTVLTDGQIVYGSPTSLYIATERWGEPDGTGSQWNTEIHRFDVSSPDATDYVASGQVPGYMMSQWSMSEHEGLLRVASTTQPEWSEDGSAETESESFVTVLATDGDRLRHVGRLGNIGRGEDIYAVRFIGDAGYIVTFRQIDPLHVIDLSDPTDPRQVGELEIPGYSAYLHPVGPGLLLGVGRDVSPNGIPGGVQASLFDVSDPAHPVRLDRENFGGGSMSEVEYDHHAFSWFADTALAAFPIDAYDTDPYSDGGERFGFVGLRVTPGSADPLGRVARPETGGQVRRTLVIDGRLYAVGTSAVGAYDPATLAPLGSLDY